MTDWLECLIGSGLKSQSLVLCLLPVSCASPSLSLSPSPHSVVISRFIPLSLSISVHISTLSSLATLIWLLNTPSPSSERLHHFTSSS